MDLRAVLFDYGGTLDGEASHWLDRFVELYRGAEVDRPFDEIKAAFYQADDAAYRDARIPTASLRDLMDFHVATQLASLGIDDRKLHERLVTEFVTRSERALEASRAVLRSLAGQFRLGVVSNFYGNVDRILADARIAPLLSVIVDSTVVGMSKPDPGIFAHAVAALEMSPAAVLHVGDSYERDVCAAHAAGLRTAWLTRDTEQAAPADTYHPDLRVGSLHTLVARIATTAHH
jgi:HAD superfamily hydrolase (TIGR01549 family)